MTPLRRRMLEDMQIRNFSKNTQETYLVQVACFARHFNKSPELLGPEQIRAYQIYLTNDKRLCASSIGIATAALRFLYRVTLKKDWDIERLLPTPKWPQTLPVVLSAQEVRQFLSCVSPQKARTILTLCYAAGLRISEAIALKSTDIDSHAPMREQGRWLGRVLRGYFAYHAVPTNLAQLRAFRHQLLWLWHKTLQRRSQKVNNLWRRMTQVAAEFLPRPRIQHPWPGVRFLVKHSR